MKTLILFIGLLSSFSTFAQWSGQPGTAWECVGKTTQDTAVLKKLKYEIPMTVSKRKYCGHIVNFKYVDLCKFNDNELYISQDISRFKSADGTEAQLLCDETDVTES